MELSLFLFFVLIVSVSYLHSQYRKLEKSVFTKKPIIVEFVNNSANTPPKYESAYASGLDLRSNETLILQPNSRQIVGTGLYMDIPIGYEGQVRPRSGNAAKAGVTVLNTPGTIDSDYRGEIKIILYNSSTTPFEIVKGDRIAQLVICPVVQVIMEEHANLSTTPRGAGGFGHTGVK